MQCTGIEYKLVESRLLLILYHGVLLRGRGVCVTFERLADLRIPIFEIGLVRLLGIASIDAGKPTGWKMLTRGLKGHSL